LDWVTLDNDGLPKSSPARLNSHEEEYGNGRDLTSWEQADEGLLFRHAKLSNPSLEAGHIAWILIHGCGNIAATKPKERTKQQEKWA
jgi:hypothetical protein